MNAPSLAPPEMNATPLIDVPLVLLVMLIFTLPVATHAVKLNLPQRGAAPPSAVVLLHVDFDGQLSLNGEVVRDHATLDRRLRALSTVADPPRVRIVPDDRVRYEHVAYVLAAARRAGVTKLDIGGG